ncbi:hypothetical protein ACFL4L_03670 [bacterium]
MRDYGENFLGGGFLLILIGKLFQWISQWLPFLYPISSWCVGIGVLLIIVSIILLYLFVKKYGTRNLLTLFYVCTFLFFGGISLFLLTKSWIALIVAIIAGAIGHFKIIEKFPEYYCADCGQFLGPEPTVCTRCGSNRYTDSDPGVGHTFRTD